MIMIDAGDGDDMNDHVHQWFCMVLMSYACQECFELWVWYTTKLQQSDFTVNNWVTTE